MFVPTSLTEIFLPASTSLFLNIELNSNVSNYASVLFEFNYLRLYILSLLATITVHPEPENVDNHSLYMKKRLPSLHTP